MFFVSFVRNVDIFLYSMTIEKVFINTVVDETLEVVYF